MNYQKTILVIFSLLITSSISAQKTAINTNYLKDYNHAIDLYQNKVYLAALQEFNQIAEQFDNSTELKANCQYYAANCAIKMGLPDSDQLMHDFVDNNPTSTKKNSAFMDVADYYFSTRKFSYAAKWYSRVKTTNLPINEEERFNFNYGYSLFATKHHKKAIEYFLPLLESKTYGSQAKYYYGYIAYNKNDYNTADKYLKQVEDDPYFRMDVSYYLADMNFKLGKFEKAIDYALPFVAKAKPEELSEISKIIGESYFNLGKYDSAIPYLKEYKGKSDKLTNTDYYFLGYAYYQQNDYENAISYFNKIIDGNNAVAQNAYYHLGECYLELAQKQAALNAFRNASQMKFKPEIKKDAWLNYAKLSYDIGNPYKSVPEVLKEYNQLYPNNEYSAKINDLIINAYITSKDYNGALEHLKTEKSSKNNTLFQKIAFLRGSELFTEEKYNEAKNYFESSLTTPIDGVITARALFWKGESNYRLNNFTDAVTDFKTFIANNNASETEEHNICNYNLGYAYFKQKKYELASESFKNQIQLNTTDEIKINDSYLRIGDCYFANSDYANAIDYYNKALELDGMDADYAQFQKAISYGLTGNEDAKLKELNLFLQHHLKSIYRDNTYYVLGDTHLKQQQYTKAINSYNQVIKNHEKSPFVSKAMLKKGLIYYNTDNNNKALTTYKKIIERFPNTPESNQAVKDVRQIYVDLGKVDEYASWVKTIDFVNVTDAELDNDMFESAEKQYLQNNHKKAIEGFLKYNENFSNGLHKIKSNYYLAASFYLNNQHLNAIPNYLYIVNQEEQNEFTEESLSKLSLIYLEDDNWEDAMPILERLEKESTLFQNILFAQSNLMKGYYTQKKYQKAVKYADIILLNEKIEDRIKSDAHIIIARSAIKNNDKYKAREAYEEVEKMATGELKAEALYYSALFENEDGSYRVSNEIVQKIAADYALHKYWASKGLIIMAQNYYELNDAFQATYILESVIKNFEQFSDVVDEAKAQLKSIKTEQAETNESIKN